MNIGIIGTGNIGSSLGKRWTDAGHTVMFGSRDAEKAQELATAKVRIPMAAETESLNAMVAASIILFEAARQGRK